MLRIMREEEGIDFSGNQRKQLTPELVEQADRVIVIAPDEPLPDYLRNQGKVTFWEIPDLFDAPYESVRELKNQINRYVEQLVAEVG